jgi:hypothetical protein
MARFQTTVTAVVANRQLIDGVDVRIQEPEVRKEEEEGHFPHADYAFENGVLTLDLTRLIESKGNHGVREGESSRLMLWHDAWRRVAEVATELRHQHPESFRRVQVRSRNGETKECWAFTKTVRLKKYARKRLAMGHEHAALSDSPRFLLTDAVQWESGRMIETWRVRWAAAVLHECSKQGCGLEAAQGRNEEAVNRHLRLRGLAQSILQRTPTLASPSEQFAFAKGTITFGKRCRAITREVFSALLSVAQRLFAGG